MARKDLSRKSFTPHHLFALLVGLGLLVGSTVLTSLDRPDADAAVSQPTLSSPSGSGTYTSPTLTSSAFSGDGAHAASSWVISTSNSCTSDVIWEKSSDATNLTSILVDDMNGSFAGSHLNHNALKYGTTYYACVKHDDSSWSTPVSFTTEDLSSWSNSNSVSVIENSGSTLSDYQVLISLSSTNHNFGLSESDCSDFRFSDSSSEFALPHYTAHCSSGDNEASFWVKTESLTASQSNSIKMHYGNASAATPPDNVGRATFNYFMDENNRSDWTNGFNGDTAYPTLETSGDYVHIAESESGVHRYGAQMPSHVAGMSSYVMDYSFYATNASGADDLFILGHEDLSYSDRGFQHRTPNYNSTSKFGFYDGGNRVFSSFSFDTEFRQSAKVDFTDGDVSYYAYDNAEDLLGSYTERPFATGSPSDGPDYLHIGTGGSQNVNAYIDYLMIREYASVDPGIGIGSYEVSTSNIYDNDFNGKLDTVTIEFTRDIDVSSLATSDFTLSTGHTVSAIALNTSNIVTLTLTEAGSSDYTSTGVSATFAGAVDSTIGESISSGSFSVLNPAVSCPFVDGSALDGDGSSNGAYTLNSDYSFTNNYVDQLVDCDLDLTIDGATLTMLGNTTTGSIPHLQFNNLTVTDDGVISADEKGCVIGGNTSGYGPDSDNICVLDGQGTAGGGPNKNTKGRGGGHGGNGGINNANDTAGGSSYDTESNPLLFGASGSRGYSSTPGIGGGVIRITVDGTLTLDGEITADGGSGTTVFRGGSGAGAGGSINIDTDTVASSSGTITAHGGGSAGSFDSSGNGGCGGGGRIALSYTTIHAGTYSTWNSGGASTYAKTGCSTARAGTNGSFYLGQQVTPPVAPTVSAPSNGSTDVSRAFTFTSSTYSDDTSAAHSYTDWEVASDSGFSDIVWSSVDDSDDLESITVNASKGTFAGTLSGATQLGADTYYARVRHANSAGESSNSSTSSFTTANTAPVVSNLTATQKNDGSGTVDLTFDVDDADDDQQLQVKIEMDIGAGYVDVELSETDDDTTASSGDPKVENDDTYQIGNSSGWVNTQPGLLSLSTDLLASNFSGLNGSVSVRITANDGTADSTAQTLSFTVDQVTPSEATSFTTTNLTSNSVSLAWDAGSDTNYDFYRVYYGTNEVNVEAQSGVSEWDADDDANLSTVSTVESTITSLSSETTYFAVICVFDSYGNKTCTADAIEFFITSAPSLSNYSAAQNQLDQVAVSFRANDPDGDTLNVSVEYSLDGGSTWNDPTLSGGSITNSEAYQIRSISTSGGAADVDFIWNAAVDVASSTDIANARLRLRGNDGGNNSAYLGASTNFELDLVDPTTPGSFTASNPTSASVRLDWAAVTESNFTDYKVLYGTSSGSLSSTWDTGDAANLGTRTTTNTTVTSLSQETTYFFKVCAYDDYGHSACSGEVSKATGSVPTVGSITPAQKNDGTGHVDFSVIFDDADDNDLRAKIEISLDGGDTWSAASLRTGDAYTSASSGDPGVNNVSTYQLGITGSYISTSEGANTVSFDISSSDFEDTDIKEAFVRITPNDLGADGTRVTSGPFIVDTVDPTAPTNLSQDARVGDIMALRWDPVTESNFNYYEIWYGKDGDKVGSKTTTNPNGASKFDHITGDTNLTRVEGTSTTLVGLDDGATYSVMVCAYDDFGNSTCSDVSSFVENIAPIAGRISLGSPDRSSGKVKVCTRVYDTDNPTQMQLGADYSINDGTSWSKMTIDSSGITASVGTAPGLNNSANYQLGKSGSYIDMSTGENKLCFLWKYRDDMGSVKKNVDFRFRPYDGTKEGTSGNGTGTRSKPPRAYFAPSCTALSCDFDASGSTASSSAITTYTWRFGDGSTGSNVNPSHDFTTNGTYYVTLTVTDLNGKSDNYTAKVIVSEDEVVEEQTNVPPVAALVASCNGLTCSFDSSNSTDSDGTIASYSWTFGDGSSSTSASPSNTFSEAGTYIARLVVTDDDGDKDMTYDEIVVETTDMGSEAVDPNVPPTSSFSYTCSGLDCTFDSSDSSDSDGSISSYLWQFGDKSGSTSAGPSHSYTAAGTYQVQLEVTDNEGLSESSFERITVKASGDPIVPDQPPVASFTYSCDSLACSFDASGSSDSDGTIDAYIWSYGDGEKRTGLGATPSRTFTSGGTKIVTLVVEDDAGNRDITYQTFNVVGDSFGGGDGEGSGNGFLIDEVPPTAPVVNKDGTTHQTLDLGLNSITDSDLFKREVWISEVETNTNNRNIAGAGGALRWDEGYDPNLLSKNTTSTTVNNLEEWTEYYVRVWARDVYGNESNNGEAVLMRTNDRADASDGSESKATNGTGEVTIGSTFGDRDNTETAYATYEYNIGEGWRPMTIDSVASAEDGSPAIDGNQVGTSDAYIPVDGGDNDVSIVWDSKTDLPTADVSDAQIRIIPNDTLESGEALIMQDIILDNVAPSGFGGGAASHVASLNRRQISPDSGFMARLNFHAKNAMASVLGRAATETVTVSWTPVSDESNWYGIASYWVTYGTSSDALTSTWDSGDDAALTTMATSSTSITSLLEDSTYYFKVYAQDAFGNQSSTSVFSVTTSSGGSVVVSGGGGGFVGEVPSAVIAQNEEDFVFEYELPDHWSAEYIEDLLERDYILELIEEDERVLEFMLLLLDNPNHSVSREESLFLMAIVRGELPDENFIPEEQSAFTDVTDSNPLYDVILQSYENGEVEGHPDGSFKPKGSTKRVEALKFIMQILDIDVKDEAASFKASTIFTDVQGGIWYSPFLDYAIENEIVNGYTDGSFRPSDTVTLAEMLKMALLTQ